MVFGISLVRLGSTISIYGRKSSNSVRNNEKFMKFLNENVSCAEWSNSSHPKANQVRIGELGSKELLF
uniref:Uncharacterized protein n=1 Tax=Salix viminalis TaxID=40686 RepID=A0A6N2MZ97_SALVM